MPRTHATIWGAPKEIAIPRIAAMHQPQEMRLAIAMPPSTMTRITATGVSHARILVCRAVAPVMNGEAACARAGSGREQSSPNTPSSAAERSVGLSRGSIANPLFVRGVGWHHRDAQRTRALWGQDAVTTRHFGVANWVQKLLELAHGICTRF